MKEKDLSKKEKETVRKEIVKELKNKILTDVEKEIKDSIENYTEECKDNLKEDLINDVNNEIEDLVKREEKRFIKSKNVAIFKRDFIILVLFAIGLYFGYCLYDAKYFDFMKSECERAGNCNQPANTNSEEKEEEPTEPLIVKDTKWYIENYGYLLEGTKLSLNADNVSAYYLYSTDRKVSDIKSSALLNMAYKGLNNKSIKANSVSISVDGSELRNSFEKLFGSLTNYKAGNFTYKCLHFKYNQEKDRYSAENVKCPTSNNKILENISDMYEEGDVLYIITYATLYNELEESFYSFDNLYEPIVTNVKETDLENNARKLNRYQYQFKKIDDTYYFDSIIKLK